MDAPESVHIYIFRQGLVTFAFLPPWSQAAFIDSAVQARDFLKIVRPCIKAVTFIVCGTPRNTFSLFHFLCFIYFPL